MERKGAEGSSAGRWGKGGRSKDSRGSVTRLEQGVTSTESEEELFRRAGTSLQLPIQGTQDMSGAIKVTTNVDVKTTKKGIDQAAPGYYLENH